MLADKVVLPGLTVLTRRGARAVTRNERLVPGPCESVPTHSAQASLVYRDAA